MHSTEARKWIGDIKEQVTSSMTSSSSSHLHRLESCPPPPHPNKKSYNVTVVFALSSFLILNFILLKSISDVVPFLIFALIYLNQP